jgi:hypothetical protein
MESFPFVKSRGALTIDHGLGVEGGGRLVEEQDLGIAHEDARQRNLHSLAAGELVVPLELHAMEVA